MGHHAGMTEPLITAVPTPGTAVGDASWPARAHVELHEDLHAPMAMPACSPGVVSYWVQPPMDPARVLPAMPQLCSTHRPPTPEPGSRTACL